MAGLPPVPTAASRNRLLLGLLLVTLLLSTALNLYLLFQGPEYPAEYELDAQLPELVTEVELQQVRRALAECQAGHPVTADTLSAVSASSGP
ncbi:hypothetical protein K3G63_03630 [Hymenobacter sp. HSC-4F20]|uniref:hypothetical protein n=1 Tax=Hymenobacter sp. HSC-4F20 TaxID=2864135 RepID=UPI001C73A307|nr:hypothetical protein [Hymenobacter sp. HSC-4F20]MBX0289511.1 hypothetical protein [Hymenobacter sp. HSC-4F20]